MSRLIAIGMILATLTTTGCVGFGPCGDEQFRGPFRGVLEGMCSTCGESCCNCDGYNPPFGSIRRTLACGSGCGEIYYGEWRNNLPDPCNDCDTRGVTGRCLRYPWLSSLWRPWGVRYRSEWGYGNPCRAVHSGYADYGYRPGMFEYSGRCADPCGRADCETGCATGDCGRPTHLPAGSRLQPIPGYSAAQPRMGSTGVAQVNYESPLVRASRVRSVAAKREVMSKSRPVATSQGRLKKQQSLR